MLPILELSLPSQGVEDLLEHLWLVGLDRQTVQITNVLEHVTRRADPLRTRRPRAGGSSMALHSSSPAWSSRKTNPLSTPSRISAPSGFQFPAPGTPTAGSP